MEENFDIFGDVEKLCMSDFRAQIEKTIQNSVKTTEEDDVSDKELMNEELATYSKKKPNKRTGVKMISSPPKGTKIDAESSVSKKGTKLEQAWKGRTRRSIKSNPSLEETPIDSTKPEQVEREANGLNLESESFDGDDNDIVEILDSNIDVRKDPVGMARRGRGARGGQSKRNQDSIVPRDDAQFLDYYNADALDKTRSTRQTKRGSKKKTSSARTTRNTQLAREVICIGSDDDEAPNIPLFVEQQTKQLTFDGLDNSFDDENPEISVKIKWGSEIEVFMMRKYQKFSTVLKELADKFDVNEYQILLNLENKIILPDDTVDSIKYKVFQFISGRVVEKSVMPTKEARSKAPKDVNLIKLKVQTDKRKHPMVFEISKNDKFKILYIKCSEEMNEPVGNIKLSFDGDFVDMSQTPVDLELDGGEIIDMRIINANDL